MKLSGKRKKDSKVVSSCLIAGKMKPLWKKAEFSDEDKISIQNPEIIPELEIGLLAVIFGDYLFIT